MVMKKFLLVLGIFLLSGIVSGLPNDLTQPTGGLSAVPSVDARPVLSVDFVQVPSADIIAYPIPPVPVPFPTPSVETESFAPSSIVLIRGSGSSLTVSEMRMVMGGGRNYDTLTKTWGFRPAFSGMKRERFLLSWEAKRLKVGASGVPIDLSYSK